MVKGETKSGISYEVNESVAKDMRLIYYLGKLEKQDLEDKERVGALFDLLCFIFGSDKNALGFMDAVAKAHGDVCTSQDTMSELNDIFSAINGKN